MKDSQVIAAAGSNGVSHRAKIAITGPLKATMHVVMHHHS